MTNSPLAGVGLTAAGAIGEGLREGVGFGGGATEGAGGAGGGAGLGEGDGDGDGLGSTEGLGDVAVTVPDGLLEEQAVAMSAMTRAIRTAPRAGMRRGPYGLLFEWWSSRSSPDSLVRDISGWGAS